MSKQETQQLAAREPLTHWLYELHRATAAEPDATQLADVALGFAACIIANHHRDARELGMYSGPASPAPWWRLVHVLCDELVEQQRRSATWDPITVEALLSYLPDWMQWLREKHPECSEDIDLGIQSAFGLGVSR